MKKHYSGRGSVVCGRKWHGFKVEVVIEFDVKGWEDKGVLMGPPEHCYPPERDETRTIVRVSVSGGKGTMFIPPSMNELVWAEFGDEIDREGFEKEEVNEDDCRD